MDVYRKFQETLILKKRKVRNTSAKKRKMKSIDRVTENGEKNGAP